MNNYFVIHESFGSPFGNWFEGFRDEISDNNNKVVRKEK